ncbi:MAG: Gfo/Idh/MocA family oxidoreductase [Pirellulales bacterium]|nr:Gfo/Idh/MocA family oxidoreductase [Pirellulales bacterium]
MNLTTEQRQTGRQNFYNTLGVTRRDFLKASAAVPIAGAFYFGYAELGGSPVRAGLIGTGSQGGVLLTHSNPDYLRFTDFSEIRPSQVERIKVGGQEDPDRIGFLQKYNLNEEQFAQDITYHEDYRQLLASPDIELVVIALPLHDHYQVVVDALDAGKHVLCESLLAREVGQCKELARKARQAGLHLAVGYQRNYSVLYDNARSLIDDGLLGDVHHVRAYWHRNNTWPQMHGQKPIMEDGEIQLVNEWRMPISGFDSGVDFKKYGYRSLEELCWWRLYQRTSEGLLAELGSHQLDACSALLGGVQPLSVCGIGTRYSSSGDDQIDDQIFATFEFPGKTHPQGSGSGKDLQDIVVASYSAITSNSQDQYGEQISGTRGTLFVEAEKDAMLFKETEPGQPTSPSATSVTVVTNDAGSPALDTAESSDAPGASAGWGQGATQEQAGYGFREQTEHLAWCIRNPAPENQPRCGADVALATAVCALTTKRAIREGARIEFQPEWFDPASDEVPPV